METLIQLKKNYKNLNNLEMDGSKASKKELNRMKLELSQVRILKYPGHEFFERGNRRREARDEYYQLLLKEREEMKKINNATESQLKNMRENIGMIDYLEKTYYTKLF